METKSYIEQISDFCWNYGPKALIATAAFVAGWWLIRRLIKGFDNFLRARKVDPGLRPFFTTLADTAMKVVLIFMVANTIGIETTSFIAIFSAIAFSVGLALQGSLGNFASGVLILLFKPFKAGDYITVIGHTGTVSEIQIFSTILTTEAGKKIIIPNGKMTEGAIVNVAGGSEVQVGITLLADIETPLEQLRSTVKEVAEKCPWSLPDREPEVQVQGISRDDIKVNIGVWTHGEYYEKTMFFLYEELLKSFDADDISLAKERRRETL